MTNNNCCAYVAVKTEPKATKEVFRKLADTRCVKKVNTVSGRYDVLLFLEAPTPKELFDTVLTQIRTCPGITFTETWHCCE